ncbi:PucR family transcriptional regulator [Deinococcus multiflagellatus]|uniref:PucR family transcriptional regulator n=1 Tax=Deinococcus multiflagellatus TaxID=1656887 RepID=A0ABW1ZSA7_9DEIO|nr:PucR family transcriptional regulator [Deinococcus multiflagellatus]MBZ9716046.1 helix-turn-helix domain-containing protein [Deinococcus multiflagellatus]
MLDRLQAALADPHPEEALMQEAARLTGGYAELRASWGDVVASAGRAAGPQVAVRLEHGGRHVGLLVTAFDPAWAAFVPVLQAYALLARLQAAAAGAARRRVGERALDALLAGRDAHLPGLDGPFALAVGAFGDEGPSDEQALDVLAGAGEGYFQQRRLLGHSTVQGRRAVWLWRSLDLGREAQELHRALAASTNRGVRLGISARSHQPPNSAGVTHAFGQAQQALRTVPRAGGGVLFEQTDPLHDLIDSGALATLHTQLMTQLAALKDGGRVERTLRHYLHHPGSLAELAQAEGVHVNTIRARLKRAEEVLGQPLSHPALLGRLYLAFAGDKA